MKIRLPFPLALFLAACGGNVQVSAHGTTSGTGGASSTSSSTPVGGAGSGGGTTVCGGLKSLTCAANEWCDFPNDDCGGADGTGICRPRPQNCAGVPPIPVCACDGKGYSDSCHAEQAGLDISKTAACAGPAPFACGPALFCKTGEEYCDNANGFVAEYNCLPLPASCLPPQTADCGCMPIAPDCGSCSGPNGQITESHGCG